VSDAPTPYIDIMKKNIICIEIEIMSMGGRFKMSQEKPKGDCAGVIKGFQNMGSAVGTQIAGTVPQRATEFGAAKEEKQRP
jgi:transcriptional regulator